MKERMTTQLLNTVKEISTVNITQSAKPRPIFTCENEICFIVSMIFVNRK